MLVPSPAGSCSHRHCGGCKNRLSFSKVCFMSLLALTGASLSAKNVIKAIRLEE
jgi:hypothetical protein